MNRENGQLQNELIQNYTKKSADTRLTQLKQLQRFTKSVKQRDFKPKLLLRSMKNYNMSYNIQPTGKKLETLYKSQQSKANAWQYLDSLKLNTKKELQKTTPLTPSISHQASDTICQRKRITKRPMRSAMSSLTSSIKPVGKEILSPNSPTAISNTPTEGEEMDTAEEIEEIQEVPVEDSEEDEVLFLDNTQVGTPPIRHPAINTTITTTITTKTTPHLNSRFDFTTHHKNDHTYRQTALQHPFRWYQTRRTTTTILSTMKKDNFTSLATLSCTRGLQDTIQQNTATVENPTVTLEPNRTTSSKRGSPEVSKNRHHRNFTRSEYGLPIQFFQHSRTKQEETNFGLSKDQPIYSMPSLQNGGCTSLTRTDGEERLYVQVGFERRLCSCGTSPSILQVSYVYEPRYSLSVQDVGIRDECQPTGIFENNAICNGKLTKRRYSTCILSRRHLPISKNKRRDVQSQHKGNYTPQNFRVYNQQRKECAHSFTQTGVPRLSIQFHNHEDHSAYDKNQQIDQPNKTGFITTDENLQMVCKPIRENDVDDTGNWRSSFTHPVFAERLSTQSSDTSTKMGSTIQPFQSQYNRITMVDQSSVEQEWITNTTDRKRTTCHHNTRRRVGYCLGSRISRIRNYGLLDKRRKRSFYQRQRTISNLVCDTIACKKVQELKHKIIHRQYDSSKICYKIRRHFIPTFTRSRSKNSRHLQSVQFKGRIPSYTWSKQHSGRPTQSSTHGEPTVRSNDSQSHIQQDQQEMGTINNRCIRVETKSPITSVLEPQTRSRSHSIGCLQSTVDNERDVLIPTLEIHSPDNHPVEKTED